MKKITCIIAALALTAWGCSSNDDEPSRPYSSRQDLLCAIIGGEIRGVAPFDVDNNGFVLTIAGSSSDDNISLSYYCDSLHRIFTIPDWTTFDTDIRPMGKESVFTPIFVTRTDFTF